MTHRYGRHGPGAWRRWRKRTAARPGHNVARPAPVEPVAVVYIRLPVLKAERIIIVPATPDEHENSQEQIVNLPPVPAIRNTNALPGPAHDPFEALKQDARVKGGKYAQDIIKQLKVRNILEYPTVEDIHENGSIAGYDYLSEHMRYVISDTRQMNDRCNDYAREFFEGYRSWFTRQMGNTPILDNKTKDSYIQLGDTARADKKVAAENSQHSLTAFHLVILPIIRAYDYASGRSPVSLEHFLLPRLPDIERYVNVYRQAYESNDQDGRNGGEGRSQRPGGFLPR